MKEKIMKILVIVFMTLTFFNILLPDEFVIGILKLPYRANVFEMLIRWFNFVAFITLPIAVFFKRKVPIAAVHEYFGGGGFKYLTATELHIH